jgi:HJR/Mrr/RecB family endonuclease
MSETGEDYEGDDDDDGEMPWESAAREAVEEAVSNVEFDEVRGVVYLPSGEDHRFNRYDEEFDGWEAIKHRLTEVGESEWFANVPFDGGEAVFSSGVDTYVESAFAEHKFEEFFEKLAPPVDGETLVSSNKIVPPGGGLVIQLDTAQINAELVSYLGKHPEKMRDMTPRKFEELVAELFRAKGYEVILTPQSRDGGLDIRAYHRGDTGTVLTLIECKRYAAHNPVDVAIVRGLYGVTVSENATRGIIATTSYFSQDAKSFQAKNEHRLHLADFTNLKQWLAQYPSTGS